MISISSPTSDSSWASPFDVSGTCSAGHTVTVTTDPATETKTATPQNGSWSVQFGAGNIPVGRGGTSYSITAKCTATDSDTVNNVRAS